MKKYIIAPERCRWEEVEAMSHEAAYAAVCCWYGPERRVAVIDAESGETAIFTRSIDRCGNLKEIRRWKA